MHLGGSEIARNYGQKVGFIGIDAPSQVCSRWFCENLIEEVGSFKSLDSCINSDYPDLKRISLCLAIT